MTNCIMVYNPFHPYLLNQCKQFFPNGERMSLASEKSKRNTLMFLTLNCKPRSIRWETPDCLLQRASQRAFFSREEIWKLKSGARLTRRGQPGAEEGLEYSLAIDTALGWAITYIGSVKNWGDFVTVVFTFIVLFKC